MSQTRPDLTGEMRVRFPLPIVIPFAALAVIAGSAWGFSRILLSVPKEAAVALAMVMALNILGACAFVALRPRLSGAALGELTVVVLYPVIIGIAIAQFGLGTVEATSHGAEEATEGQPVAGGGLSLAAAGVQFTTSEITLPAGEEASLHFANDDTVPHNVAIYPDEAAADAQSDALFQGEAIDGGSDIDYPVPPLDEGEYVFQCDIHPTMRGTAAVE